MISIKLPGGEYRFDESAQLGPSGGFGQVFLGEDRSGNAVAIKRLHLTADGAAHRELRIAEELKGIRSDHIVPILDAGQDAESDRYYLVMPVAEGSLQDRSVNIGRFPEAEAVEVLRHIAAGLADARAIVHRDLKPGNVLWLDGRWQIADFGIARFVEDSTSLRTLKEALTPHFAAPEQWRLERATAATDIYALGCIGCVLLVGAPPFGGSIDQIREGHLSGHPSLPNELPAPLRTILSMMLRKPPEARPSLERVRTMLANLVSGPTAKAPASLARLSAAAAQHEAARAEEEARQAKARSERDRRNDLAKHAASILGECYDALERAIVDGVPGSKVARDNGSRIITVAGASLQLDPSSGMIAADAFPRSKWDVVAGASIGARDPKGVVRAASLWYTRREYPAEQPRWFEVGYQSHALSRVGFRYEPTALTADMADRAHSRAMDVVHPSYDPVPIDEDAVEAFCERWVYVLTMAAEGRLDRLPKSLPRPGEIG